jgi:hypothetical protein
MQIIFRNENEFEINFKEDFENLKFFIFYVFE